MIIVELSGGLGNQLFQYAFGRFLSLKNGCELKLDIFGYEDYEWHDFSLEPFNVIINIASKEEVGYCKSQNLPIFKRICKKLFGRATMLVERNLSFDWNYLLIPSPVYLKGYWQSAKYFSGIEDIIRNDFKICIEPSKPNHDLLTQINSVNSVSLHIRRGNYVNVDFVNGLHGTCSLDYYKKAADFIALRVIDPVFYIFSDDIIWARENLSLKFKVIFVDLNNDKYDYEDLRLMVNCKHNIIANSTFSWWGAWLNVNPEKCVIAPKRWFADSFKNQETEDLIPISWIRI